MLTARISFRRKRRGVASILGTIIFIGIMFTAVIPMYLVMKQADTLYESKMLELRRQDEEREREDIELYAYPNSVSDPGWLNVTVNNVCELEVTLIRLWINNESIPVNVNVDSMRSVDVGSFNIDAQNGSSYSAMTVTERGNKYASETGILHFNNGEWESETLGFNLIFPSRPGRGNRQNSWLNELRITIEEGGDLIYNNVTMHWAISASEKFLEVGSPGDYRIIVYIWCKPPPYQRWEKVFDDTLSIDWPEGPAVVNVNFKIDGDNLILE